MFLRRKQTLFSVLIYVVLSIPQLTFAEETYTMGTVMTTATFRWNNENWFTEKHPKVATFTVRDDGSAYGMTETGIPFSQENIENDLDIRIQRFVIEDHHHYIIDGREAPTFIAFSKELARVYEEELKNTQA